jgi:FMN-dependent NADH-azoreductase
MKTILQLNNSLFSDHGQSSRLADQFVARVREEDPQTRVIRRDLAEHPVPHLDQATFSAGLTATDERTAEQARAAAHADTLVEELQNADTVVIGVPVYNFLIPSTLKAWFDHVARAGTTFRYTENGPEGLLEGKRAHLFVTSGGRYAGTDIDFAAPYVQHMLAFLGINDVTVTRAEGLAMGEETSAAALESARERIERLAA